MDPEGDYESRHSTSAHVNTQEEEKAEEVYDGPTAPPLSLAGMEPNVDPSPNQEGGQDQMPLPPVATDKLAPPDETVSQSVAIPIGLDTVDAKLPCRSQGNTNCDRCVWWPSRNNQHEHFHAAAW